MEKSGFFKSKNHDRRYKAEDWADYFYTFFKDGVLMTDSTNLQVLAGDGMSIIIRPGKSWIHGYMLHNTGDLIKTIDVADGLLDRIDRVVVRLDIPARCMNIQIKKGSYSTNPVAQNLIRNNEIYELGIADVMIRHGITSVTQSSITDKRLDSNLCGPIAGTVNEIDTAALSAQLESNMAEIIDSGDAEFRALKAYMESLKIQGNTAYDNFAAQTRNFMLQSQQDFSTWFNGLKDVLSENAETNILGLIENIQASVDMIESVVFNDIKSNPYLIKFDTLAGVNVKGVWNQNMQRIEC